MNNDPKSSDGRDVQNGQIDKEKKDLKGINEDVSGNNLIEENKEDRKFHEHGRTKYKSHSNHSSADDQPRTDTGPGTV